jgi:hypothetical protein
MQTYTIPVRTKSHGIVRVTVLADNEDKATLIAVATHGIHPVLNDAQDVFDNAEFRDLWPLNVRKAIVRACKHDGPLPEFGRKEAAWAVRQAWLVEDRCRRQEEQAEQVLANLPASERAKVNA